MASALADDLRGMSEPEILHLIGTASLRSLQELHRRCFPRDCGCKAEIAPCVRCARLREVVLAVIRETGGREPFELREVLDRAKVSYETVYRVLRRLVAARLLRKQGGQFCVVPSPKSLEAILEAVAAKLERRWSCDCPIMVKDCGCPRKPPEIQLSEAAEDLLLSRLKDYAEPPEPPEPSLACSQPAVARIYSERACKRVGLHHYADAVQLINRRKQTGVVVEVNRRRNGSIRYGDVKRG